MKNLDELASWVLVDTLGKLKFSKSSYYYLILVPIMVKLLDKVSSPLHFNFGGSDIELVLELPFSWYLFYLGALAISLASIVYEMFCPALIKKYKNYGQFLESGESDNYLHSQALKHSIHMSGDIFSEVPYLEQKVKEEVKIEAETVWMDDEFKTFETVVDYKHNIKYQEDKKNYFNSLYENLSTSKQPAIYTSLILYTIGFLAFGWVIVQNIIFVVKHLM